MWADLLSAFLDPLAGAAGGGLMDALGLGPDKPEEKKQMAPQQFIDKTKSETPVSTETGGEVLLAAPKTKKPIFGRGQNMDDALNRAMVRFGGA